MCLRSSLHLLSLAALTLIPAAAQSIVSARSGVVNFSEGAVFINEIPVEQRVGAFPDIKEGSELRTGRGRAEVLLTPGVFLRLGEQSAIRMNSTMLVDTQVEFLAGSAMLEVSEKPNATSVIIGYHGYRLRFPAQGSFRIDSSPEEFRVLEGEAEVSFHGQKRLVEKGCLVLLSGSLITETFTPTLGDGLYEWSMRRSDKMALANTPPDLSDALGAFSAAPGGAVPDGAWVTSPFSGISTYVPSYGPALSALGIGYSGFYSPYGLYWGAYAPLSLRSLGSSYYRPQPGHVTHGSYGYTPAPIYRSPATPGFGRTSHGMGAGAAPPVASPARSSAPAAPRAGHR